MAATRSSTAPSEDIKTVQSNVRGFAVAQGESMPEIEVETAPGVVLGHRHTARTHPPSW
ncbi:MAG TPA: hypothetical protein VGL93_15885 [Streptosporangiaceae bacterium]|jgi:UDP-2,3-diacylglucosamine pyrophosphatase LpxH